MDFAFYRWKKLNIHSVKPSTNPKERFRDVCLQKIKSVRKRSIPPLHKKLMKEAVLIEYRQLPHLEFLIRNTILHLGSSWSHTIVCGTLNYDYMVTMCASISPNIHVIKTPYANLNQTTYSTMLASVDFWKMFDGEKILIYQEDSCIFKTTIDEFLCWDYIGAPWPVNFFHDENFFLEKAVA